MNSVIIITLEQVFLFLCNMGIFNTKLKYANLSNLHPHLPMASQLLSSSVFNLFMGNRHTEPTRSKLNVRPGTSQT